MANSWATARQGSVCGEVERDEILIVAGKKKSGDGDGLAVVQGRGLVVGLVVVEGEDGERDGLVEAVFSDQSGEDGAHLLEAQRDFAASSSRRRR